ncbi:MAG: TlpA family protein disulfide reductase [Ignavibacteria bacterium]|jgi:thiol-disulfide isomerase/thioredoxin|nr:TlpA family protein disulfide reductase [Ignavibacteria bacterium]
MKRTIINITTICILFAAISFNSCSQDTPKPITANKDIAKLYNGVDVTPGKVYQIVSVENAVNGKMTDFAFLDNAGKKHSILEVTKNNYAFLNFWGTWCPPCRKEIPDIIQLQNELSNKLVVIGVAFERDIENAKKKVTEFSEKNGINYILFVIDGELKVKINETYNGINAVPTTYIVDKSNDIFEKIVGSQSKDEFMATIKKMMK